MIDIKKKLLPIQKNHLMYFFIGFIFIICCTIFIYYSISNNYLIRFNSKNLKYFSKSISTIAEIGFFGAFGLLFFRFIIKNLNQKGVNILNKGLNKFNLDIPKEVQIKFLESILLSKFKNFLLIASKILQKFHLIIALLAISIVIIHSYIFFHLGFKWNVKYILGVLSFINLVLIFITGIFRIFNKNINAHKVLGIIFIVLMLLHILF